MLFGINRLTLVAIPIVVCSVVIAGLLWNISSLKQDNAKLLERAVQAEAMIKQQQAQYEANTTVLEQSIAKQNAKVAELVAAAQKLDQSVADTKKRLQHVQRENAKLIAEMRNAPVSTLTCDQSIDYLRDSIPNLSWGVK